MSRTRFAAVIIAGALTVGSATAVAAPAKPALVKPTCGLSLTEQIPAGETAVNTADTSGSNVGTVTCGKLFGKGLASLAFTVPASGNLVGAFKEYFALGSVTGKYVLVPDDTTSNPQPSTFAAASYTGTLTVKGGTGSYKLAKGIGTITCKSPDSIHLHCVEHLKLSRL